MPDLNNGNGLESISGDDDSTQDDKNLLSNPQINLRAMSAVNTSAVIRQSFSVSFLNPAFAKLTSQMNLANVLGSKVSNSFMNPAFAKLHGQMNLANVLGSKVSNSFGLQSINLSWRSMMAMENSALKMIQNLGSSELVLNKALTSSNQLLGIVRSARELADWANENCVIHSENFAKITSITDDASKYVDRFSIYFDNSDFVNATLSSFGSIALFADVILANHKISHDSRETIEQVESKVLEPWEQAHLFLAGRLISKLEELHPLVAEAWKGASEELGDPRSFGVSKIANCLIETLILALHCAAPDEKVIPWIGKNPPKEYLDKKGKPTRRARTAFILSERSPEEKIVQPLQDQVHEQLKDLLVDLQAAKHTSNVNLARIGVLKIVAESILVSLFLVD